MNIESNEPEPGAGQLIIFLALATFVLWLVVINTQ